MAQAYQTESESLKRQLQVLQDTAAEASTLRSALQEVLHIPPSYSMLTERSKGQTMAGSLNAHIIWEGCALIDPAALHAALLLDLISAAACIWERQHL